MGFQKMQLTSKTITTIFILAFAAMILGSAAPAFALVDEVDGNGTVNITNIVNVTVFTNTSITFRIYGQNETNITDVNISIPYQWRWTGQFVDVTISSGASTAGMVWNSGNVFGDGTQASPYNLSIEGLLMNLTNDMNITINSLFANVTAASNTSDANTFNISTNGASGVSKSNARLKARVQTLPAAVQRLRINTTNETIIAGYSSGKINLRAEDQYGNINDNSTLAGINITIGNATTGFGFNLSDVGTTWSQNLSSISLVAGNYSFYFNASTAGTYNITINYSNGTVTHLANQSITTRAGVLRSYTLTTSYSSLIAGTANAITVIPKDLFNNTNYTGTSEVIINTTLNNSVVAYDGNTTMAVNVTNGAGTFNITLNRTNTSVGGFNVNVFNISDVSINGSIYSLSVRATNLNHYNVSFTPASTAIVNNSVVVTIRAEDIYNNSLVGYNAVVNLTINASADRATLNNTLMGTGSVANATFVNNDSVSVILYHTKVEVINVTAMNISDVAANGTSRLFSSTPAGATTFNITTARQSVTAGSSSGVITVVAYDVFGNKDTNWANNVNISVANSTYGGFNQSAGLEDASSTWASRYDNVAFAAGNLSFFFNSTLAGEFNITVANATSGNITNQSITVLAGVVSRFNLSVNMTSGIAGYNISITAVAKDIWNNTNMTYNGTTNITTNGTSGKITVPSTTSGDTNISGNFTYATGNGGIFIFNISDTLAEKVNVTVTNASQATINGTINVTIVGASALRLNITANMSVPTTGINFTVNVTALDRYNNTDINYVSAGSITASGNTTAFSLFPTSVNFSLGTAMLQFNYTKNESVIINISNATVSGISPSISIIQGAASRIVITTLGEVNFTVHNSAENITNVTGIVGAIVIQLQDAQGVNVTSGTDTVILNSSSTTTQFSLTNGSEVAWSTTGAIALVGGNRTVFVRDTAYGTPTLNFSSGSLVNATKQVTINSWRITLTSGWNLVSLPSHPADKDVADVLGGINVSSVWYYNTNNNSWQVYTTTGGTSTLIQMDARKAYWINVTSTQMLAGNGNVTQGSPPTPSSLSVYQGWNMIGELGYSTKLVSTALSSIAGHANCVSRTGNLCYDSVYNQSSGYYLYGDSDHVQNSEKFANLQPGKGYWLYVVTNGTSYSTAG